MLSINVIVYHMTKPSWNMVKLCSVCNVSGYCTKIMVSPLGCKWPISASMFYRTPFSTISTMLSAYLNKVPSISYTPKVFGKKVCSLISVTLYHSLFKLFPTMFFCKDEHFCCSIFAMAPSEP